MHASGDGPRPSALVVSPEAPYPLDGGGALRTASILHYLADQYEVDLIAFQHPGQRIAEALPDGLVRDTQLIPLRPHSNDWAARVRRNAGRLVRRRPPLVDRFSGYEAELQNAIGSRRYDVALLEHFWCASYLLVIKQIARRVVLDLHNIESAWHLSCAHSETSLPGAVHRCFGWAALRLEQAWLPLCDRVLTASERDAERVRELSRSIPVCVYPNAIPFRDAPQERAGDFAIAFSANMEYEPNRTGISWFINTVWPRLRARFPGLSLKLIGKNERAIAPVVRGVPGIQCTGWVPDAFSELAASQLCIAPLLSGSGTRLKIVEAWAAERAVVSTPVGAEGLDAVHGQSILLAHSPDDFAAAVESLLNDRELRQKIAKGGRELFKQKYTWERAWNALNGCFYE